MLKFALIISRGSYFPNTTLKRIIRRHRKSRLKNIPENLNNQVLQYIFTKIIKVENGRDQETPPSCRRMIVSPINRETTTAR